MDTIIFLTLILAAWRISHLLAQEDGPFAILVTLRYWLGVRYNPKPPYEAYGKNVFSEGIICVWCNSVWVGLFCTILYIIWKPTWLFFLPFALSAGTVFLEEIFGEEEITNG